MQREAKFVYHYIALRENLNTLLMIERGERTRINAKNKKKKLIVILKKIYEGERGEPS